MNQFLNSLERKFGHLAIRDLMKYIMGITGVVYLLSYLDKSNLFLSKLILIPNLVLQGEIWRVFTFIFIPPPTSIIFFFLVIWFYYSIGSSLEYEWGSFKFNIYYLTGIIFTVLGAFFTNSGATSTYLNLSLFLAFAKIYPDYEILLYFILPIKIKYLAYLDWIFIIFTIISGDIPSKVMAITSLINYFVFFGEEIFNSAKSNKRAVNNRKNFKSKIPTITNFHKCTTCGITENQDPNMEFRYCSQCEGDYEYCMDHLKNHEHIKKP